MNPPYIPNLLSLEKFEDYNIKYCDYLMNEKENYKKDPIVLSSCEDEDIEYDKNWVNEF